MSGEPQLVPVLDVPERETVLPVARALFGLTLQQLTGVVAEFGQKPYRARQLAQALYKDWVTGVSEITTWPKNLQETLKKLVLVSEFPK